MVGPYFSFDTKQSVGDALQVLASNNIISAPVVLAASAEDNEVVLKKFGSVFLFERFSSEVLSLVDFSGYFNIT